MRELPAMLCDGVKAVGVHNGVARVVFIRLDVETGNPLPAFELQIPVGQIAALMKALAPIARVQ